MGMKSYVYKEKEAKICLVEMIGEHNIEHLDQRAKFYKASIDIPFTYVVIQVDDWNRDLSPWSFQIFGDGAIQTYQNMMKKVKEIQADTYYIAGYSLAGLFSLWVGYQTDFFTGIVACSPSVWFPNWDSFLKENSYKAQKTYLSLGTKEHKTKHPLMREVRKRILLTQEYLQCPLDFNPGNHFQDVDQRMLKGIQTILK